MNWRWRVVAGCGLVGASFLLDHSGYHAVRTVTLYEHWGEMREGLTAAKFLGSGLGTAVIGLIVARLDGRGLRRMAVLWLAALIAGSAAGLFKVAAGRERPSHLEQQPGHERRAFHGPAMGLEAPFQSFPSGHTTSSFASATCLAAFYPPARVIFYAVASATAVNRVAKHQHFVSDVAAGAVLGHLLSLWLLGRPRLRRLWRGVDTTADDA